MNEKILMFTMLWSLSPMGQVYASDIQMGQKKSEICAGCHGSRGVSISSEYPNLAGQKEQYLKKQLHDFKSGERNNPTMKAMARSLSQDDISNLAAYFSSLKP